MSPIARTAMWFVAGILGAIDIFTTFIDPEPNMITWIVLACGVLTVVAAIVALLRGRLWSLWMMVITRGVSCFFAFGAVIGAPLVIKVIALIVIALDVLIIYAIFSVYDIVRRTQESNT